MLHWQQQQLRHNSSSVYWNILTALNHTKHHRFELHFSRSLNVTVTDVLCCHLWPLLHIFWICSFAWKQIPTSLLGVTSMPEQLIQVWLHIPFAVIMWWNDGKFPWRVFFFFFTFYWYIAPVRTGNVCGTPTAAPSTFVNLVFSRLMKVDE